LSLPPLRPQALTKFARQLLADHGGIWKQLREAEPDERLFLEVVYALVPVHVRSPRRVKVLLNHYATTVRIVEARGIAWLPRASEIAVLTVFQIEFSQLAADLVKAPMLLDYLRGKPVPEASTDLRRLVEAYAVPTGDAELNPGVVQVAGDLLDPEGGTTVSIDDPAQPAGSASGAGRQESLAVAQANRVLNKQLRAYLGKVAAQRIPNPRPDLTFLGAAGAIHGLDDPQLGYVIDVAAELSPDDVVVTFAPRSASERATGVELLVQQAEDELGPGRNAVVEAVCRLVETLDRVDLERVAPLAAPVVIATLRTGSLRDDALPGALLLGVFSGGDELVEELLRLRPEGDLAASGLLSRVATVLPFADEKQAALVHQLFANTYEAHPTPLEDALHTLPIENAHELWEAVESSVGDALVDLQNAAAAEAISTSTAAAATAATARATGRTTAAIAASEQTVTAANPDDDVAGTPAERFGHLLTAIEARTEDESIGLLSVLLAFGQTHSVAEVRATTREREDDVLARIADPDLLTRHALLGLTNAEIRDVSFWASYLPGGTRDTTPAPATAESDQALSALAWEALHRLLRAVATTKDWQEVCDAASKTMPLITFENAQKILNDLTDALAAVEWCDPDQNTLGRRRTLHALLNRTDDLYPAAAPDPDRNTESTPAAVSAGAEVAVTDLLTAFETRSGADFDAEVAEHVAVLSAPTAETFETRLAHADTVADTTVALRARLLARAKFSAEAVPVAQILAEARGVGAAEVVTAWFALRPTVEDGIVAFDQVTVGARTLGAYARGLSIEDRSRLWIHAIQADAAVAILQAVGSGGIDEAAVEHVAKDVRAATAQAERDALIGTLMTASLTTPPARRGTTELALHLLAGGVLGDGTLAAKLIRASDGATTNRRTEVKAAFDAYKARSGHKLTSSQVSLLEGKGLLTKPRKKLKGFLGLGGS